LATPYVASLLSAPTASPPANSKTTSVPSSWVSERLDWRLRGSNACHQTLH